LRDDTDTPTYGNQQLCMFNTHYHSYCYLPLHIYEGFSGRLITSVLKPGRRSKAADIFSLLSRVIARIRQAWPNTRIIVRGDSGFAREAIMAWCEANRVYYILGLAKNTRLLDKIGTAQIAAHARHIQTAVSARVFTDFEYRTLDSWSVSRHVIGKAEYLHKGFNPRFIVTNLPATHGESRRLYEDIYCARGDMENRIKEQQLDLFADRTSAHTMRANQLRLWFSSFAYILMSALRRIALKDTRMANATCGTIRLKLLKIGARIKVSVRRFMIHLATACPYQDVFRLALRNIYSYPLRV